MSGPVTDRRPTVVYWNNQPTPYLVARLNAVVERGDVDLEVWFDELRLADRSWQVRPEDWLFRWRLIGAGHRGALKLPVAELLGRRPDLLICNYDRLNMLIGAVLGRLLAGRIALRALPAYEAQAGSTWRKHLGWTFVFHLVDGAKVPGRDGAEFAAQFGLPQWRSWPVKQSIDVDLFASGRAVDKRCGPHARRFVVVSRMIRSKGIDELLAAWRAVRETIPDASLILAGDGADEDRLRAASADLPEVEWLGFRQPEELPAVYAAADVLIFPTLGDPNGLVVEEAMAAGLPVISTDAAGDIRRRLPEGEAGWVVEAGDVAALAAAIGHVARLPGDDLRRIGEANARRARDFLPTAYSADFTRFVTGVMSGTRRRNGWTLMSRGIARLLLVALRRRAGRPASEVPGQVRTTR